MTAPVRVEVFGRTDVGMARDHNEDSFLVDESLALCAVADGMGGHQGGDYASRLAVEILRKEVAQAGVLEEAARRIREVDPSARVPVFGKRPASAGPCSSSRTGWAAPPPARSPATWRPRRSTTT